MAALARRTLLAGFLAFPFGTSRAFGAPKDRSIYSDVYSNTY